ncbi:MAG: mannitol dehydrogenase family protein, partial [Lachnospiraceae bacterium]|nr:mannitol dehydrogenase family protein [Lachnospiraceae bacterium]
LLYERFKAGAYPLTLQSMDNCSHNGDKVKAGVLAYAKKWCEEGLVPPEFYAYVSESGKITYPWAMIDKIVPRPDAKVRKILEADGFEDAGTIETSKHSFTAPFVNGEETGYLIIEDDYPNGKLPLELGGAVYTSREIVDKMERMKVCTCLNPLHTAVATAGCLLGYTLISDEMKDDDLRTYITRMVYEEAMPVVTDPGIVSPAEFADTVLTKRLPNPFMPDTPQRIVVDNSQKIPVRFGETIKNYIKEGLDLNRLNLVSFALASYARYLRGIDDEGRAFEPSPDPLLSELMPIVAGLEVKEGEQDFSCLKALYCRPEIFGVNLYDTVLGDKVEAIVKKLYAGPGAVRKILHEMVTS